jgi:alkanesulfonate monooxygenase SsuD/methylene tetrahydromethanopterin reductase-like flavin-dependent oxidoreductase (luciferase family)
MIHFGLVYSFEGDGTDNVFREAIEEVALAEQVGIESAFVSEHHFVDTGFFPSPLISLSFLAARTSRIKIGTGVLLLPLYNPVHVAEDCAVLDIISGGRLILGVGQGYRPEEFNAFDIPLGDRPGRVREGVTLVRRLWTEPKVTFRGKYFQTDELFLGPRPVQVPAPPIWVAAKKRRAVELAAEVGDGWFADPITPISIIRRNKTYWENSIRAAGHDPADRSFAYYREFLVAEDDAAAWRTGRDSMINGYRNYLRWGHLVDNEGKPIAPDREDLLEQIVRERFTAGGPERCVADVAMLRETLGLNHLIMKMKFPGLSHENAMNSIQLFGQKVLPKVARN